MAPFKRPVYYWASFNFISQMTFELTWIVLCLEEFVDLVCLQVVQLCVSDLAHTQLSDVDIVDSRI